MPRPESALGPGRPEVEELAAELRGLREKAGGPGYRELARRAHYSATTLSDAAGGRRLPTLAVTLAYVEACGGDVAEWEERWRRAAAAETPPEESAEGEVPYQGLAAYGPDRAAWFFGRTDLVEDLLDQLVDRRFLAVFGASGSGKSSVLRAGLVPAASLGSHTEAFVLTPGSDPFAELAVTLARLLHVPAGALRKDLAADPEHLNLAVRQALAGRSAEAELWLVVDQFEEVFTLCREQDVRVGFVAALLAAVEAPGSRLRVILGVRADFYGSCGELPGLADALRGAQVLVGPMTAAQVRDVVVRPAERAGAMVEGTLVSTIVAEVAGRAGALPMASHVLLEAWRRRRGSAVTLAAYQAAGGVDGAVAQTAERVWQDLDAAQQNAARHLLLRMVEVGTGESAVTGRRVDRAEIDETDPVTGVVLERLAAARLITLDERAVRVAHEALLKAWPRLRDWAAEDRDGVRLHRQLTHAATVWRSLERDPGGLYRGQVLVRSREWAAEHPGRLTMLEREFLDAGQHAHLAGLAARRRGVRVALGVLGGVMTVVVVLAALAVVQAGKARDQRDLARHRQLIASARGQLDRDPQLAYLLARRAYEIRPDVPAETMLRQAALDWRGATTRQVFGPHLKLGAVSRDGRHAVGALSDGRAWYAGPSGPPVLLPGHGADVYALALSRDGRQVAIGHDDGTVQVWQAADRAPVVLAGHQGRVRGLDFSPDGRSLVSADNGGLVRVWDLTGPPRARLVGDSGPEESYAVVFGPDGRRVAASNQGGPTRIWDLAAPKRPPVELADSTGSSDALLFTPDGRRLAGTQDDGTVRIWASSGGKPTTLGRIRATVPGTFSRDGRFLYTTGSHGAIWVWDSTQPADPVPLRGHAGGVVSAELGPDGRLVSLGGDGTIRTWDVGGPFGPRVVWPHKGTVHAAKFSPDGRYVASAGIEDGTVKVWPVNGAGPVVSLPGHSMVTPDVAFSSDGGRLATVDFTGTVRIWDWAAARLTAKFSAGMVSRLAFGPSGDRLLVTGSSSTSVWDRVGTATPVKVLTRPSGPAALAPDGRRLAVATPAGQVEVRAVDGGAVLTTLRGHQGALSSVAYSPDGARIATLGSDNTIRTWPADGGAAIEMISGVGTGSTTARMPYTPNGGRLAILGGEEETGVQLWPAAGGDEPVTVRPIGPGPLGFAFGPGGRQAVTVHLDGSVRIWNCEVCGPASELRALPRATRPFTREERRAYLLD